MVSGLSAFHLFRLLLFAFIDAFENVVHLLLQEVLQLLDHELVDGALLDERLHQAVDGITFVDDDALESIVSDIDIDEEFWFATVKIGGFVFLNLLLLLVLFWLGSRCLLLLLRLQVDGVFLRLLN